MRFQESRVKRSVGSLESLAHTQHPDHTIPQGICPLLEHGSKWSLLSSQESSRTFGELKEKKNSS